MQKAKNQIFLQGIFDKGEKPNNKIAEDKCCQQKAGFDYNECVQFNAKEKKLPRGWLKDKSLMWKHKVT